MAARFRARGRLDRGGVDLARAVFVSAVVAGLTTGAAGAAQAQTPTDPAAAQSLFDAGRDLMTAGNLAEACAKFEESNKLDPSAGTLLNLARCLELSGKNASAWAVYNRTISLGRSTGQARQVAAAEEAVVALEPKVSRMVVQVASPVPGLSVVRDDVAIGQAAFGVAIAIDSGKHRVRAEAPGFSPWHDDVVVEDGGSTVTVDVPALTPLATEPALPRKPRVLPADPGPSPLLIAGLVTGGVGIASLAVGTAFGVMTLSDSDAAQNDPALCPAFQCSPAGLEAIEAARTRAHVSTAMLVVGGAATATGAVLVFLGWPQSDAMTASSWVEPGGFGFTLRGKL